MNLERARTFGRAQSTTSRTGYPALSPVYSCSWLRMATVHPALP